jgi:DNA-binding transcriptional LysR family regulator
MIHPNMIDQLHMFVTAADLKSFSATARHLGRAQNAVSYGISTLEEHLDVALFDRSGHRAVLTEAGEALRHEARHIIEATTGLNRKAHELSGGLEPVLTIAIDDMVPFNILKPALASVAKTFPGLELRINRTAGREAWKQLSDGRAALAVAVDTFGLEKDQEINVVGAVQIVPVISPQIMLEGTDSEGFDLPVSRQIVLSGTDAPEASPDYGVLSTHIWRVADLKSKHDLICEGLGWGTLPAHIAEDDLANGRLRRLKLRQFTTDRYISLKFFSLAGAPLGQAGQLIKAEIIRQAETEKSPHLEGS